MAKQGAFGTTPKSKNPTERVSTLQRMTNYAYPGGGATPSSTATPAQNRRIQKKDPNMFYPRNHNLSPSQFG